MKPIAIFRHNPSEGPGYLASFLDAQGLPWELVRVDAGEPVPASPADHAGLVFMGGPMSVNDDLNWVLEECALIRAAVDSGVPVIGHCLGGQLMSKALGGVVTPNPVKEIGWGVVEVADNPVARSWLGDVREFLPFHWHGETFSIPAAATPLMSSRWCSNQAFALGSHLAMQCHVEMTPEMIRTWALLGDDEIRANPGPAVQTLDEMEEEMSARVAALNAVADRLYRRWVAGLKSD
ncbi:MAG: type 1 glutamine amidotransferase [Betaproteobacteria bacterium]|nr:type 1 glutamine amidotransferase [Betaproteobacteria bacterium]